MQKNELSNKQIDYILDSIDGDVLYTKEENQCKFADRLNDVNDVNDVSG